jgi:phosphate/sulfate permease
MANTKTQKWQVLAGIVAAWCLSGTFIFLCTRLFARVGFAFDHPAKAATCAVATAAIALIAGIGWAARTRHFVSNIDGSQPDIGANLDLTLRYVTNTTEQLVLFAIASFCVLQVDEHIAIIVLPVMGLWFVIARVMFCVGYRITPVARSIGFAATFHPTIVLFVFVFVRLFG